MKNLASVLLIIILSILTIELSAQTEGDSPDPAENVDKGGDKKKAKELRKSQAKAKHGEAAEDTAEDALGKILTSAGQKLDSASVLLEEGDGMDEKIANELLAEAKKEYETALEMEYYNFGIHYKLGVLLSKTKKYKKAVKSLTIAISIDTTSNTAFRERAMAKIGKGEYYEAVLDLDTAINLNYDDYLSFYQRGLLKANGKDKKGPMSDFDRVIKLNPEYAEAYYRRCLIFCDDYKDYVRAKIDIEKVIELDTSNEEAFFWYGKILFKGGDHPGAIEQLSKYIDNDNSLHIESLVMRGASFLNTNQYSEAVEDFNVVISVDKKNYAAYMNRGVAKGGLKQYDAAITDLDMAEELKFNFSAIYVNRALVKFQKQDNDGACKDLRKAQSLNHPSSDELLSKYCMY